MAFESYQEPTRPGALLGKVQDVSLVQPKNPVQYFLFLKPRHANHSYDLLRALRLEYPLCVRIP